MKKKLLSKRSWDFFLRYWSLDAESSLNKSQIGQSVLLPRKWFRRDLDFSCGFIRIEDGHVPYDKTGILSQCLNLELEKPSNRLKGG
ncbi:hypothetical protein AVEN_211559-1 [Araneus ventricosus]|uniref:Uncharacterized protein n=1 Tax=Araneus ventricosus TaxID=182803 RepID=A0A4Y2D6N7_ARAVE|nr:hypothetical protein AVEN_211559-1 [Araneus ventricosus]